MFSYFVFVLFFFACKQEQNYMDFDTLFFIAYFFVMFFLSCVFISGRP